MKNFALGLLIAAASTQTAFAGGATPDACRAIEQRISRSTSEFTKISTGSAPKAIKRTQPSELYRNTKDRSEQLQNTADQLWDLRTEMTNRHCSQAARFIY